MPHPASPLSLLRRAASRGLQAATSGDQRGAMPLLSCSCMARRLHVGRARQLPGCSGLTPNWRLHATATAPPRARRGVPGVTASMAPQPPVALTGGRPSPSAAVMLAAAAVASAAGSGLARLGSATASAPAAAAAATAGFSTSSTPTTTTAVASTTVSVASPPDRSSSSRSTPSTTTTSSSPSSSAPLEGTPVPWASLGPSLDLIQQRFRIGSETFRLVAPRDVDAVMDMYLDKDLLDADPYWTRAWPSAIALAATLLQRPELVAGKVVADLGAGLGLAGMAAALAGAREVVLLDREPAALQCALLSAAATGLASDPNSESNSDSDPDPTRGNGPQRRVEPLPADQLPSYAALQVTPSYRHLLDEQQQQLGQVGEGEEKGAAESHQRRQDQQQQQPQEEMMRRWREREWEVLMALARRLGRDPAAAAAAGAQEARGCSGSSSSSLATACSSSSSSSLHRDAGGRGGDASSSGSSSSGSSSSGSSSSSSTSSSGSSSSSSSSVLRAHVFDWNAPPEMARLLPPLTAAAAADPQRQQPGLGRGRQRAGPVRQRRFDVVLACDVLYEDAAVGPISGLMPLLLEPDGGRLLLADPPNRTVRNRERFLEELRSGSLRLAVEECSLQQCEVSKLDNEMAGGLAPTVEAVPVQFLVFRSSLGNDTVGLKL